MAIDLFRAGFGLVRIARALDESGLVLSETAKSQIKSVRNLFRLEALFGRRTVTIGGDETYTLEGYYPAVIKVEEFAEIQKLLRERIRQGSKSPISAIVTGLGITVCGHCTQMIVAQNNHSKSLDERGRPTETYRKLLCNSYHKALACKSRGSIPAPLIERSVMECCADEFNLAHLMEADPKHDALSGRLSTIRQEIAKLERRRDNFVDAIGDEDDKTLIAGLKKKHREASALIIEKEQSAALLEHEIAKVGVGGSIATVDLWQSLIDGVRSLDDDVRMKTRKLIADTFERIELYRDGFGADRKGAIDMLLVSKRGASVVLRIDCETKTWRAERIDRTKITSIAEAVGSVASERIAKRHAARTAAR